jgi:hypothetical protein
MQLNIKIFNKDKHINLKLENSTNNLIDVKVIKEKIFEKTDINIAKQKLFVNDTELDNKTIKNYKISFLDIIICTILD